MIEEEQQRMTMELQKYLKSLSMPKRLQESTMYSVNAGGKRLRPLLMKLAAKGLNGNEERVYPAALALEMVHTYSLIHDDLPAMDDDMYRRGQLTNHKQFDEATAILAGDGLLTNSFHVITSNPQYTDEEKVFLIHRLSKASGLEGMVAGQLMDMEAEDKQVAIEELENIHLLKTGMLLTYALEIGAYLAGASTEIISKITELGKYVGLIFQIQDDILDVIGDQELLGKTVGSDMENNKTTYPSLLGLDGAIEHKNRYVKKAKVIIESVHLKETELDLIIDYLSNRKY
jgi:geranylgeranyl diphosphate synthase, type II